MSEPRTRMRAERRPMSPLALRHHLVAGVAAFALMATLVNCTSSSGSSSAATTTSAATAVTPSVPVAANAPWTEKVTSLVGAMTTAEKLSLVEGENLLFSGDYPQGTGYTVGVSRLGIPERYDADADGIWTTGAATTSAPIRLAMGASFDRSALYTMGQYVGQEGRAMGADVVYGPQLDITRIPNWGRNQTTPGEDPYLNSELGTYEVNGTQSSGLMSCVKHTAFYNGQAGSNGFTEVSNVTSYTQLDDQTAHELYLEAYRNAMIQAQPAVKMGSYQAEYIPGQMTEPHFSCHDSWLNNTVFAGQFGWSGFTVSDYGAVHYADLADGLDQEFATTFLASTTTWATTISNYADELQQLDNSVARMLYQYERFGLLNGASASGPTSGTEPTRPSMSNLLVPDQAVTQALAEEGAVLLKNQSSVLPLTSSDLSSGVLVVGATGRQLLNNTGERSKGVPERNMISPLAQLQALAGSSAKITYLPGIDWVGQAIGSGSDTTAAAYKLTGSFTVTDSTATSGTAATSVDGHAVPTLGTTTVTGTITAPTAGNYYIWLRGKTLSSAGTGYNSAHYSAFTSASGGIPGNAGSSSSGSALTVNGTSVSLANTPVEPETFWSSGLDGYVSIGALVSLTAGANPITATFSAASISATDFPAGLTVKLSYSSPDATQAAAVAAAATAKKVIIFANDNGTSETTTADDVIPRLDQNNDALVAAVAAANTNNAVVLNIGNPVAMPWLSAVSSILVMWYPGQEGGTATADLLLGTANPGGRLPITFPVKTEDTPFEGDYYAVRQAGVLDANSITYSNLTEGIFSGYRWYDQMGIAPMFAFGEGLSYTTFKYSGLSIKNTSDGFIATFTVTNTGKVSGAVVPQLYLGSSSAVSSDIQQAKKKLVGFDRVTLASGASTQVSMTVTGQQLSYWSTATQAWVKPAGQRAVYVSDNARDSAIQLTSSVTM